MEYRAPMEKSEGWWIGQLVDLPGVNAQELTQEELPESLKAGAQEMLDVKGIGDPDVKILVEPMTMTGG
jgi:predicted RNase H-like HicB family nuclease